MPARRVLAVALCAVLACARAPVPLRPEPPAAATRVYPPFAWGRDARLPGQAVILATDDAGGSTVLPLPGSPGGVVVDVPAMLHITSILRGDIYTVRLSAAVAPPPQAGSAAGPAAPSTIQPPATTPPAAVAWRARALPSAELAAATTLGKDVTDIAFSAFDPGGATVDELLSAVRDADAAASTALFSAGLLAAMIGDPIDPAATLTGMILPDGTIGPVDHLPERVIAALAHRKTRIGVPAGMRTALMSGRRADLVELARASRAQIVELATLHDAYRLLTGRPLVAPVPATDTDMALDPEAVRALGAAYLRWQKQLAEPWAALLQLEQSGRQPDIIKHLARRAHEHAQRAEALHRDGKLAAAIHRIAAAWVHATAARETQRVLARVRAGDVAGALAALDALATDTTAGLATRVGELRPTRIDGHLALVAAIEALLRGTIQRAAGDPLRAATQTLAALQGKPGTPVTIDAVASDVATAALVAQRAIAGATLAEQMLDLAADRGAPSTGSPPEGTAPPLGGAARGAPTGEGTAPPLGGAARGAPTDEAHRAAAAALLQHDASPVPPPTAPSRLDHLVATALSAPDAAPVAALATAWTTSLAAELLPLAASRLAHRSAALARLRTVLAIELDDTGAIRSVGDPATLRSLLAASRSAALTAARAARVATGEIPLTTRLAYQLAVTSSDAADPLDTLAAFWLATASAHTAVMLAR